MAIAGAGLAVGLIASFWLDAARCSKFLYGVTPHDAVSFAAVAALLLAGLGPREHRPRPPRRAVDPVKVLRA